MWGRVDLGDVCPNVGNGSDRDADDGPSELPVRQGFLLSSGRLRRGNRRCLHRPVHNAWPLGRERETKR